MELVFRAEMGTPPDGYQVLMRIDGEENQPDQLILTLPGLVALNGMNSAAVGVCVNTLMQLKASSEGLPVAFVIRGILALTDKDKVLKFIKETKHASGQNYIIGIKNEVFDYDNFRYIPHTHLNPLSYPLFLIQALKDNL